MRYTIQPSKTMWEGCQLVSGINCQPESVYDDFLRTKLLYHKDNGTLFFHMVQSFPKGEKVDPRIAHTAALKLAGYFEGREVLVSTHVDREHIHSHFLINSVSFEDGRKLHISKLELSELRQHNDQICAELGLPVFQPQKKKPSMSGAEYRSAAKGESWKFRLMNTIDECMQYAASQTEFISLMQSEGYQVRWTDSRKNITYTTPGGKKCRDDRLHDEKYLKEKMELEFRIRAEIIAGRIKTAEPKPYTDTAERNISHSQRLAGTDCRADGNRTASGGTQNRPGRIDPSASPALYPETDVGFDSGIQENPPVNGTGWEEERASFFTSRMVSAPALPEMAAGSGSFADVAGAVVQFGHALERDNEFSPIMDSTTTSNHTDRKLLRAEKKKKLALGHKKDDHEESFQQSM